MFVASITTLVILLNNENLNGEMQANVVHGEDNNSHQEEALDYESLAPETSGPAVIVGLDGLIDYANEEFKKETRFIESEVKDQLFFSYVHPQDLAKILASYGQVLSSQKPDLLVGPFRMKNAAGEYLLQMAAMQPIFEDDHMVGVAIETEDISENLHFGSSAGEYEIDELGDESYNEDFTNQDSISQDSVNEDSAQVEEFQEQDTEDEVQIESNSLEEDSEFQYSNFESEYLPPAEQTAEQTENSSEDDSKDEGDTEDEGDMEETVNNEDEVESTKEKEHEDQGNHYGEIEQEVEGAEDINKKPKDDKKIRDKKDEDKKLVVDNLARVVNKVYRDPDVLALLF